MRKFFLLFLFHSFFAKDNFAQFKFIKSEPPASQTQIFNDAKKYGYNPDGTARVDIKGSEFWNDEWKDGELFNYSGASYGNYKVKINLLQEQVYFLNQRGAELVTNDGAVQKVIIYDSLAEKKIKTIFRFNIPEVLAMTKEKTCLVQEMNQGHCKLLRITRKVVESSDSLFGTIKTYSYKNRYEYFVERGLYIDKLKKLSKDDFLAFIPTSSKYADWIKEHNLKFKTEADIILFLTYYNDLRESATSQE